MFIYIAHAEADQAAADELKAFLKTRGLVVHSETGARGFAHLQPSDVVIGLWSRDSTFASHRLQIERRMFDAWADERLVLVKLGHTIMPVGLRDLPFIDASFDSGRDLAVWPKVERAAKDAMNRALVAREEINPLVPPRGPAPGGTPDRSSLAGRYENPTEVLRPGSAVPPAARAEPPSMKPPGAIPPVPRDQGTSQARAPEPMPRGRQAKARGGSGFLVGLLVLVALGGMGWGLWRFLQNPVDDLVLHWPSFTAMGAALFLLIFALVLRPPRIRSNFAGDARKTAAAPKRAETAAVPGAGVPPAARAGAPSMEPPGRPDALGGHTQIIRPGMQSPVATGTPGTPRGDGPLVVERNTPPLPPPHVDPAVFISYSHADSERVDPVVAVVQANGRLVWIDKTGLSTGEGWAGEIVRAIKSAKGIMVMCSKQAFESDHVKREVYLADRYKKPMAPVFLEEAPLPEDFEYFFASVQWLELWKLPEADRPAAIGKALEAV